MNIEIKNNFQKNKAITLISLAVTVVIISILAGVSVNLAFGNNGLLNKMKSIKNDVDDTVVGSDERVEQLKNDLDIGINISEQYEITYDLRGGVNPENQPTSFSKGQIVKFLNPQKDNSFFDGWYETEDYSSERITMISNRNKDIILYAKWLEETPTEYFTFTTNTSAATINGFSTLGLEEYNKGNLKEIAIPAKYNNLPITGLAQNAFLNYTSIKKLLIGDNLTRLNSYCFRGCTGIKELTIPISLNAAQNTAFLGCNGIEKINFTVGTGIGSNYVGGDTPNYGATPWAYSKANKITATFEEGITRIGNYMFYNCTGLSIDASNITLDSLETIGLYAFYNCRGITGELNIKKDYIVASDSYMFYGCTGLTKITVGEDATKVDGYMFYGCSGANEINIGEKVTVIRQYAFMNCTAATKMILGNSVNSITTYSFRGCSAITNLTLPISLNTIAGTAFLGCTGIRTINFTAGTGNGYKYASTNYSSTPWYLSRTNSIEITIDSQIQSLGTYTFYNCTGLSAINYKNQRYTRTSDFISVYTGTIGSNCF